MNDATRAEAERFVADANRVMADAVAFEAAALDRARRLIVDGARAEEAAAAYQAELDAYWRGLKEAN